MNLLTDPALTLSNGDQLSFPALFGAMARGGVRGFRSLRPHQRPAWHMFLVQLGALALWHAHWDTTRQGELPHDPRFWTDALRRLTAEDHPDDAPWDLMPEDDDKPGFLQAPIPSRLKWSPVPTPDALDLLITARNHDLKQTVARRAGAEDWVFALVSLQTMEGFGGARNYGIARMNGGSSSRSMLGLAPTRHGSTSIDPSGWWERDVRKLLSRRAAQAEPGIGTEGGPSLLWCLDWPEGQQLDLRTLDPWFIEVCRRIRLTYANGKILAYRSTSKVARIAAKQYKGVVGDPWMPVHRTEGKSFTLSSGDFDYRQLYSLLFSGDWEVPSLAQLDHGESAEEMLLVAEALSRGNAKTEGFKSRIISVPGRVASMLASETASTLAKAQIEEIGGFDVALRNSLALVAARGDRRLMNQHFAVSRDVRVRFSRIADRLFFPSLWRRVDTASRSAAERAKIAFLTDLWDAASTEFEAALPGIHCPAIQRPRAEARATRAFRNLVRNSFPELLDMEGGDAVG